MSQRKFIAKAVSQILGGGRSTSRDSGYMYVKNYDFMFSGFPFARNGANCEVTMTSVAGHLTGIDFSHDSHGWENAPSKSYLMRH